MEQGATPGHIDRLPLDGFSDATHLAGPSCGRSSRGRAIPAALAVLAFTILIAGCGSNADDTTTVASGDQVDLSPATLPAFFSVDQIGLAGGFGWLILADEEPALWRVDPDGSASQATAALSNFSVTNVGNYGDSLVLSGTRCDGPRPDGGCDSTAGVVQVIEADGTRPWETEIWSVEGNAGEQEAVPLVGATKDELWVVARDGSLVAIDPAGQIVRTLPSVIGDPCVLNGSLFAVSEESLIGKEEGTEPSSPPTTAAEVDSDGNLLPQEQTFVIQEAEGDMWQVLEGSDRTFRGGDILAECANEDFNVSIDDQPVAHWTESKRTWVDLPPAEPLETIGGSETLSSAGSTYAIDPSGAVRRQADDSTWSSTGIVFDFAAAAPPPGVGLVVAEDGQMVFACAVTLAQGSTQSACQFGRIES